MKSVTLKSAVLLAGAALFCFGFSVAARAEGSVAFTGGYTTTFSNSDGDFGAGIHGANIDSTPSSSGIISDDYRDEITTNKTWDANAYQGSSLTAANLGETNLWILTPGLHPGFGFKPQRRFIRGLNVSEGGAPLLYILLAGFSCFGALFIKRRRAQTAQ